MIRAPKIEKEAQILALHQLHQQNSLLAKDSLQKLQHIAIQNLNIFEGLMEATKYCSLGQITHALYEVGGQYRRNM